MDNKILITYASKYGATKEIAERIDAVLQETGLETGIYPVDMIRDLTPYRAVILGSAVYLGKWQKDAVGFLQTREKDLIDRPVWLFSSGPTGRGDPVKLLDGKPLPAGLQSIVDRIQPRDIAVFHGHININKISPTEKWVIKSLVKKPFGDFRDWDAIVSWGTRIAAALKEAEPLPIPGT